MSEVHVETEFVNFLLVEDDEDHALLVTRTLEQHRISNRVFHVKDGVEAMEFLTKENKFKDEPSPHIIILDLNLPKMNGHEVLKKIKADARLRHIPVVVLSTSDVERDRELAYAEHANSYLVKPLDFGKFKKMVDELSLYWGVLNAPPKGKKQDGAS